VALTGSGRRNLYLVGAILLVLSIGIFVNTAGSADPAEADGDPDGGALAAVGTVVYSFAGLAAYSLLIGIIEILLYLRRRHTSSA
jgi:hypothetical protein